MQGLPQLQGVLHSGLVILQELGPPRGVGWAGNRERGEDGDADGIGYLVALAQTPVGRLMASAMMAPISAPDDRAEQGVNDELPQAAPSPAALVAD